MPENIHIQQIKTTIKNKKNLYFVLEAIDNKVYIYTFVAETSVSKQNMPLIEFEQVKEIKGADIYIWHITESCKELATLAIDGEMLYAESQSIFKSTSRQREWLATRALLCHTPYKEQKILYRSNGQPYLTDNYRYISISHTREYVAIAISEEPIGIDIEMIGRNAITVIKAILSHHEMELFLQSDEPDSEALRLWTAKEAAFKLAPERCNVLKEIISDKYGNTYLMTYPDGTSATSSIHLFGGLILSCCRF